MTKPKRMINSQIILKAFLNVLPSEPGWVVIHSSIIHLNISGDDFKWEFLKIVKNLVERGYTLALPAFTFSFCSKGYFDPLKSKSEVSILADWAMELYDSTRTKHPIYSHVLIGPNAKEALEASTISCCGKESIYQFFERENATICMLGIGWHACTPFHYFEEQFQVPYRYYKDFVSKNDPQVKAKMYVRNLAIDPRNNFLPAVEALKKQGMIKTFEIGDGMIQSTSFNALSSICNEQLSKDIYCYVKKAKKVRNIIFETNESTSCENIKVVVLANNNFEPLENIFKEVFAELCPMRQLEFFLNSYDQMTSDIYSGKIYNLNPDYCFLPSRLEDIYKVSELEFADTTNLSFLDHYIEMIKKISGQIKRKAFIHLFPVLTQSSTGSVLFEKNLCLYQFIQEANLKLIEATKDLKNIKLVSPEMMGIKSLNYDPRLWYLGRMPYLADVLQIFSEKYCGYILNDLGKTVRLLVLDLDNTLWGGVLGEDGMKDIALGGDFPGNSFKDFQKTIISLKNRGIALAIVSKNDEEVALNCIEKHPEMLIKKNVIAAYRINWREKYINIKEIAKEIGLGLSNIMFVDDNPVEREKVRINLPEVKILELPQDPALYRQTILKSPFLSVIEITKEDNNRATNYTKKRALVEEQDKYENIEDFLSSLNITIEFNQLDDYNFSRALQLINKTNQFNTTTRRYTEKNLKDMLDDDHFFVGVLGYTDQMTEFENIGVFIVEQKNDCVNINTLLLSCRVLGKCLENTIVAWIVNYSRSQGFDYLCGEIIETPRNTPVRDLYKKLGFTEEESGKWCFQTSNKINTPTFIKIGGK
jgi:FkbH-like protein